jgi:hypothetical protein
MRPPFSVSRLTYKLISITVEVDDRTSEFDSDGI